MVVQPFQSLQNDASLAWFSPFWTPKKSHQNKKTLIILGVAVPSLCVLYNIIYVDHGSIYDHAPGAPIISHGDDHHEFSRIFWLSIHMHHEL